MPVSWPQDKLGICNSALAETGNYQCAVVEDGSNEWNVCSPAYERAMATLLEDGNYGFGTQVATLAPDPTAPTDTDWDTAYALPPDLLHLIWVKWNQAGITNQVNYLTRWDILDGKLVTNAQGGPPPPASPVTAANITIKYVSSTNSDAQSATPLFVTALTTFVMSGIYRGLHNNAAQADKLWLAAEQIAQRARTRYDQQKPKRQFWNSRLSAARRVRRPWINDTRNWF